MNYLAAKMRAIAQRLRGPQFAPGTVVANIYSPASRETLQKYLGPYIGGTSDDKGWECEEEWRCDSGAIVAAGYHWMPVPETALTAGEAATEARAAVQQFLGRPGNVP